MTHSKFISLKMVWSALPPNPTLLINLHSQSASFISLISQSIRKLRIMSLIKALPKMLKKSNTTLLNGVYVSSRMSISAWVSTMKRSLGRSKMW